MRWTILSILFAVVLALIGLWISDPLEGNVAPKAVYWFTVTGFLLAQGFHFFGWVRKHDL